MVLADTQSALWLIMDTSRLSPLAEQALRQGATEDGIAIAAITLWEIAMLHSKGRIQLHSPVETFLETLQGVFITLPLTRSIAVRGNQFTSPYPKDPADRQIGATALAHSLKLVTSDKLIRKSRQVPCIW
jgi:PIN domain nuclease of toxin-antitoxin system